ncbi:hypothetical protein Agub_g2442 [Astrephomene gubernaculifera]|uniref:N-alpha-acetyltransferase 35, NatC auxiliary subunit n=1 Tax=Astrephomene gubernaculifera TaxID=47775 RepID=A0AAD3DH36_9CHLO|nr:hypothetical protein Agub_g2442 [Astrephomene gubernaculifera]
MEKWTDVGPLLQAARADMKVGQLLAGEAFSLFEAMSALEAGNPKMDAAASPVADQPNLETLLADPTAAPWDLPTPTLLAVLDQLLAMEASWHCGGSAMQTVYACLYMLKLNRVQEYNTPAARALYAYCRTLQHDCAAIRDVVLCGGVCEEEDINIFTAGIPFEPPVAGPDAALDALEAAIAQATATSAAAAAAPANGDGASSSSSSSSETTAAAAAAAGSEQEPLGAQVGWRLQLRRAVHLGLRAAIAAEPKAVYRAASHFAEARQLLGCIRQSSASASKSAAPSSSTSASASAPAPASAAAAAAPALAPGFHLNVNRHLLGPAPPRQVQVKSLDEALSYMEQLMDHLQMAVTVSEHVFNYRSLQLYLWRFARMRPSSVARSLLHSLLLPERWQPNPNAAQQQQQQAAAPAESSSSSSANNNNDTNPTADSSPSSNNDVKASGGSGGRGKGGKKSGGGRSGSSSNNNNRAGQQQSGATSSSSTPQQQQQQPARTTPAWVPSKEMIAEACQVPYKAGLPEDLELFFEQATIAVSNVCQALLMNRCRCRRRLRRCLDDWLNMTHHAANAEETPGLRELCRTAGWRRGRPQPGVREEELGPLSMWVEYSTCSAMLHHLLQGFELEVYEPLEYDMIYWYADYLCTCMINAFSAIMERCPLPQPPKLPSPAAQAASGPAGGRGLGRGGLGGRGPKGAGAAAAAAEAEAARAAAVARFEKEQQLLRYDILEVEALQRLCQGMLRLMAGLRLAGSVPEPRTPLPFNSKAQRFDQRFASFGALLRPPPLSYDDYLTSMDPGRSDAAQLLSLATASFKDGRARCAALKAFAPYPDLAEGWVRGLERVAGVNAVVAGVLAHKLGSSSGGEAAAAAAGQQQQVSWLCDWAQHAYFPGITLPKPTPAAVPAPAAAATTAAAGSS